MLAPRRVPPCLMASVAALNTPMNDTGPKETPAVVCTTSVPRAKTREREPRAAARFMDKGGVFDGFEYGVHRIFDGKDETGGKLLQGASGIRQRRRVRQEVERGHGLHKTDRPGLRCRSSLLNFLSAWAIASATRRNISAADSITRPFWSLRKYLLL